MKQAVPGGQQAVPGGQQENRTAARENREFKGLCSCVFAFRAFLPVQFRAFCVFRVFRGRVLHVSCFFVLLVSLQYPAFRAFRAFHFLSVSCFVRTFRAFRFLIRALHPLFVRFVRFSGAFRAIRPFRPFRAFCFLGISGGFQHFVRFVCALFVCSVPSNFVSKRAIS